MPEEPVERSDVPISASIIIPTFNGSARIGNCLSALAAQIAGRPIEILVVDDGSTDHIADVVEQYPAARLIVQKNAGPASARNRGAREAAGKIILFTDDDCVPMPDWLDAMLEPFKQPDIVGAKGVYRTRQKSVIARFVQIEYEDKYRLMKSLVSIDFIDTYSAGFVRDRFLEMTGYDTSFPVACAEDVELSYRMSARGWKMVFALAAVVFHTHPGTLSQYLRKKYKFAFWRVLAVSKNPGKAVKDSHTPQVMKLQLLLAPALIFAVVFDLAVRPALPISLLVLAGFMFTALPFTIRAVAKDPLVGILSPVLLAARACAQFLGVAAGLIYARQRPAKEATIAR